MCLHGKVYYGSPHVGSAPLGTFGNLSLSVVLGSVAIPAEFGKVLAVVEGHFRFGGIFDLG